MTLVLETSGPEQTGAVGETLGRVVHAGEVLLLQGPLGAGKTRLTQGLAQGLGVPGAVTSPTFILVNEYRTGRLPLYHIDLYRIERVAEAIALGLDEYFFGPGVSVVEWADRAPAAMPEDYLLIELAYVPGQESGRRLRLTAQGERHEELLRELRAVLPPSLVTPLGA